MKPFVAIIACTLGCIVSTVAADADSGSPTCRLEKYVNEELLLGIVQSKDGQTLRELWSRTSVRDLVTRVYYFTRLLELEPSADVGKQLLETLPSSQIEFDFLYSVNNTKAWERSPEVSRLYGAYFQRCAQQVAKHVEYATRLLSMSRFADGEAKNLTDEANESLKQLNPKAYLDGLRSLDPESRKYVCGDCTECSG